MRPSQRQALAYWLAATGVSVCEIGRVLCCSSEAAQGTLAAARRKAQAVGLTYACQSPVEPKAESGLSVAKRLAQEAGLV